MTPPALVCSHCLEPLGTDVHMPGSTHGSTFWIRYPDSRSSSVYYCDGKAVQPHRLTKV